METPERQLFRIADEEPSSDEGLWFTRLMLIVALAAVGLATVLMLLEQHGME